MHGERKCSFLLRDLRVEQGPAVMKDQVQGPDLLHAEGVFCWNSKPGN